MTLCCTLCSVRAFEHGVTRGDQPAERLFKPAAHTGWRASGKMADDGKEPEETGEEGAGEDVEAEANVEFKPLIDVSAHPAGFCGMRVRRCVCLFKIQTVPC
jgi:hypothetical protein